MHIIDPIVNNSFFFLDFVMFNQNIISGLSAEKLDSEVNAQC